MGSGHIELDRAVDSIRVGYRHRQDLGDLEELIESIRELGLMQPITISPDATLICGARRLAAVKALGWKHVNVWVRSGISTPLERLLAEQHENTMRKPLTPTEAATLYRELKALMAEDAARRQYATRFGNSQQTSSSDGAATVAAPAGDARVQAAAAITGTKSYTTLERVSEVQRIADDPTYPEDVRDLAAAEVAAMDADGTVAGHYRAVKTGAVTAELERLAADPDRPTHLRDHAAKALRSIGGHNKDRPAELLQLAQDALARAKATRRRGSHHARKSTDTPALAQARPVKRYGVRAFVLTWAEMDSWAEHYDPAEIGPALSHDQWARFEATVTATVAFADAARLARDA